MAKKVKCDACGRDIPDRELGELSTFEYRKKEYNLHESCARTIKIHPELYLT